jgi:hypothetical protein
MGVNVEFIYLVFTTDNGVKSLLLCLVVVAPDGSSLAQLLFPKFVRQWAAIFAYRATSWPTIHLSGGENPFNFYLSFPFALVAAAFSPSLRPLLVHLLTRASHFLLSLNILYANQTRRSVPSNNEVLTKAGENR